jgi:excisionase family DNA binding protein
MKTNLPDDGRIVYSVPEAAKLIGVGKNQLYDAANMGTFPAYRVGRTRWVVPRAALESYLMGTWQPLHPSRPPVQLSAKRGAA